MRFQTATKKQARLRAALIGPAGAGKTYTALALATALGKRVAVIDSERGSASKYVGPFRFDVLELDSFSPRTYVEAIKLAEAEGYDAIVIDSLSHAWMGKDGALEQVDKAAKRGGGSSFAAWRDITPLHNQLVDAMIGCRAHVIATLRSKTHYDVSDGTDGRRKGTPIKVGLAPVQKEGLEYEFDLVADLDQDNNFVVTKSRCPELSNFVGRRIGEDVAGILRAWLTDGEPAPAAAPTTAPQAQPSALDVNIGAELVAKIEACTTAAELQAIMPQLSDGKRALGAESAAWRSVAAQYKAAQVRLGVAAPAPAPAAPAAEAVPS